MQLAFRLRWLELVLVAAFVALATPRLADAQEAEPHDSTLAINGIEMYFRVYGKGSPVLLVHGFNMSGSQWRDVVPLLAKDHQVIVPDLRGHGHSTNPLHVFTHRQAARDILALLDSLHLKQVKAMGVSTGAMTLEHAAIGDPSRFESLVLISGTTHFGDEARKVMAEATPESITPDQWMQRRRIHRNGDDQIRDLQAAFRAMKDSYDDMNLTRSDLSKITARTLIIHGDRDPLFPVAIATELFDGIKGSELFIVPGGAHGISMDKVMPIYTTAVAFLNRPR